MDLMKLVTMVKQLLTEFGDAEISVHKKRAKHFFVTTISRFPREKGIKHVINVDSIFWDVNGVLLGVAPNGIIDSDVEWLADKDGLRMISQKLPPDTLHPFGSFELKVFADSDVVDVNITAQAPADIPSTPALESISQVFHCAGFVHSKAALLEGSVTLIPRQEP